MSSNSNTHSDPLWHVLELRATAFMAGGSGIDSSSLWEKVIGGTPDEEQRRPREGLVRQTGSLGNLVVVLQITQENRLDFFLQPRIEPSPSLESPGWPELVFPTGVDAIKELFHKWCDSRPSAGRLAFGSNLVQPAPDLPTTQARLRKYLPNMDLEGSIDFFYQVNRPRDSQVVAGLRINRLCRWSIMNQVAGGLSLRPGNASPVLLQQPTLSFAGSLALDINTAPERNQEIPSDDLDALFSELVDVGKEIAERGDIK